MESKIFSIFIVEKVNFYFLSLLCNFNKNMTFPAVHWSHVTSKEELFEEN